MTNRRSLTQVGFFNTVSGFKLCLLLVILLAFFQVTTFMTRGRSIVSPALWSEAVDAAQVSDIVDKNLKSHLGQLEQKLKYALAKDFKSIADEQFQRFQDVLDDTMKPILTELERLGKQNKSSHVFDNKMKPILTELERFGEKNKSSHYRFRASQAENNISIGENCEDSAQLRIAFQSWQSNVSESRWDVSPVGEYIMKPSIKLPKFIQTRRREACDTCQCSFINECLLPANCDIEKTERMLAFRHIPKDATVLEVGARYGSVSCAISHILLGSGKLVSVEADPSVWESLERNKNNLQCNFHIAQGMLSKKAGMIHKQDYASHVVVGGTDFQTGWKETGQDGVPVPNFSLTDLQQKHNLVFDVANFDCEGCFNFVVKDFPELTQQAKLLIVEVHNPAEEQVLAELIRGGEWQLIDFISNVKVLERDKNAGLRHVRFRQPITWSLSRQCKQDCTQACLAKNMHCDDAAFPTLKSEEAVRRAFEAANFRCPRFKDLNVGEIFWDGPWENSGECGYSSNERTTSFCSTRMYNCGFNRLCPCF